MDVIYVSQQLPVWEIHGNMLSQFFQIWRVLTQFLISQNLAQKKLPNKRTLKYPDQKSNHEIGVRQLCSSPILHWFYPTRYMISFWCGNVLLIADFKNIKAYQYMWGQQENRPLLFYQEKFNQIDSYFPHNI